MQRPGGRNAIQVTAKRIQKNKHFFFLNSCIEISFTEYAIHPFKCTIQWFLHVRRAVQSPRPILERVLHPKKKPIPFSR